MNETLPVVRHDLPGWTLFWAHLCMQAHDPAALARAFAAGQAAARDAWSLETLAQQATVAAVRVLFRQAGCDPTRYRPSSEALLRRVLKGEDLPAIHPAVDVNNLLSIALGVPACVVDATRVTSPFVLRAGRTGERMLSMRGDFDLEGKPLLEDAEGPFGTPITDSERVKIQPGVGDVLLVAYLPAGCDLGSEARATLGRLLDATKVAALTAEGLTN